MESIPFYDFDKNPTITNQLAITQLARRGYVKNGDLVIVTKGDFDNLSGGTNGMKILRVGESM